MHTKTVQEMSQIEALEWRANQVEQALAKCGIQIPRSPPVVLGRSPGSNPRLTLSIAKANGRWIKLYSRPESKDDVCLESWRLVADVRPSAESGSGTLSLEGEVMLTNTSLVASQQVWDLNGKDVLGQIEVGDICTVWFGNSGWSEQGTIAAMKQSTLTIKGVRSHPIPEQAPVNVYNEYQPDKPLVDPTTRSELTLKKSLSGLTVEGLSVGRIGANAVFNGKSSDIDGRETDLLRQISVWCSRYENNSKDGISMTVELPRRS